MSKIQSIVFKPVNHPDNRDAYLRVNVDEANLIAGKVIEGGSRNRHLNVMSAETLSRLSEEGFATNAGQMGEQLVIKDLNVDKLPPKTRVQLGENAVIELFELRTPCSRFEHVQDAAGETSVPLGMMARVITGGKIRIGDEVSVLK